MKCFPTFAIAVCGVGLAACSVKSERPVQQPAATPAAVTPAPAGSVVYTQPVPATTTVYTTR